MDSLEVAAKVLKANVFSATGENISEKQAKYIAAATITAWLGAEKADIQAQIDAAETFVIAQTHHQNTIDRYLATRLKQLKDTTS